MASQNFPLEPRQNDTFNDIWPQKNLWSTFSKKKIKGLLEAVLQEGEKLIQEREVSCMKQ